MGKRAVSYLRVSGRGRVDGFDRQRQTVAAFARAAGFRVEREYREEHTGTDQFTDMLAALLRDRWCRTVLVESVDRVARNVAVRSLLLARLQAEGIAFYDATTGKNVTEETVEIREAMVEVQGVFAEVEKKRRVERLSRARLERRALHGRSEGRLPFGMKPGEAATLTRLRQLARKPRGGGAHLSCAAIAATLNAERVPTRTGRPWAPRTVYGILKRAGILSRRQERFRRSL